MNTTQASTGDKVSGNYHGQAFTGQVVGSSGAWLEIELDAPVSGNCSIAMHRQHDAAKVTVVERYVGELEFTGGGVRIVRTVEALRARFAMVLAWSRLSANAFKLACIGSHGRTPTTGILWVRAAHSACENIIAGNLKSC